MPIKKLNSLIMEFAKYLLYLPFVGLLFYGCSGSDATIINYINPSLNSSVIKSASLLPLHNTITQQNTSLGTANMAEIDNMIQMEFASKNSKTQMLDPKSSTELLKKFNLINSYDTLITDYDNTNIPNVQIFNRIGQNLKVDAIIQGFLVKLFQRDGHVWNPSYQGETKITIKYVMFSTNSGEVLWEATCEGYKSVSSLKNAPSISDMIEIIRDKIIDALPTL